MNECTFNIEKRIAVLSGSDNEIQKQINLISWNGKTAVIDIRAWSSKGKPYKGVTLSKTEARVLRDVLNGIKLTTD